MHNAHNSRQRKAPRLESKRTARAGDNRCHWQVSLTVFKIAALRPRQLALQLWWRHMWMYEHVGKRIFHWIGVICLTFVDEVKLSMEKRVILQTILFILSITALLYYTKINLISFGNHDINLRAEDNTVVKLENEDLKTTSESVIENLLIYGSCRELPAVMQETQKGARILLLAYGRYDKLDFIQVST